MFPDREVEVSLCRDYGIVVGLDEVGRGALAGPVCVGAAAVSAQMPTPPSGVRDSKLLSPTKRQALVDPLKNWVLAWGIGWVDAPAIDDLGLTAALRMAGESALEQVRVALEARQLPDVGVVLLDGKHNWLAGARAEVEVVTQVKADLHCLVVASASVLAKVARDDYMATLDDPGYGWAGNKGYASAGHREALMNLGISDHHRKSWNLVKSRGDDKRGR